jgi:anaerobic selenocysteine-containing dehydrogenase
MLARQVRSTNSTNKPAINDNPLTAIVPLPTLEVDRDAPQPAPRFSFLPLVRASNTLGAVHMGMATRREGGLSAQAMMNAAGERIAGLYVAGQDLLMETMDEREAVKSRLTSLDVLIVQDMFLTETAALAHVVFPSTSFAESQGTQVNNGGQVQMVRRTIPPVGQARPDWMITNSIARLLGEDFGFQGQLKQIFREISERVEGYQGLNHSRLVNEGPQQVASRDVVVTSSQRDELLASLRRELESLPSTGEVDRSELAAKAGSRLQQRYPAITRYSRMLTAAVVAGEEAQKPVVYPA